MAWVVDTAVLLDVRLADAKFGLSPAQCLEAHLEDGLVISPATSVELAPAFHGDPRLQGNSSGKTASNGWSRGPKPTRTQLTASGPIMCSASASSRRPNARSPMSHRSVRETFSGRDHAQPGSLHDGSGGRPATRAQGRGVTHFGFDARWKRRFAFRIMALPGIANAGSLVSISNRYAVPPLP